MLSHKLSVVLLHYDIITIDYVCQVVKEKLSPFLEKTRENERINNRKKQELKEKKKEVPPTPKLKCYSKTFA